METKQKLPTLIELANNALVWSGKNEKTINIKITIPTARMIVDADQETLDALLAQRDELLRALGQGYLFALATPHDTFRALNQAPLCAMRNAIAKATGRSAEDVQNDYESYALAKVKGAA